MALQLVSPPELGEFDDKGEADNDTASLFDQLDLRGGGSAGSQKIIVDKHALTGLDSIRVDLKNVGAILERILTAADLAREFTWLARGSKANPERVRQSGT